MFPLFPLFPPWPSQPPAPPRSEQRVHLPAPRRPVLGMAPASKKNLPGREIGNGKRLSGKRQNRRRAAIQNDGRGVVVRIAGSDMDGPWAKSGMQSNLSL